MRRGDADYCACPAQRHEHDAREPKCQLGGEKGDLWHCHKCSEAGGALKLVRLLRGCDARGAFDWLREAGFLGDLPALGGPDPAPVLVFLVPALLLAVGWWMSKGVYPDVYEKE